MTSSSAGVTPLRTTLAKRRWTSNARACARCRELAAASRLRGGDRSTAFAAARAKLYGAKLTDDARAGDFSEFAVRFDLTRFRLDGIAFLLRTAELPKKALRATALPSELKLVDLPDGGVELVSPKAGTIEMRLDLSVRP